MTKTTLLFTILVILCYQLNAQELFKGSISYNTAFEVSNPKISVSSLESNFGTSSTFHFESGLYYQTYDSGMVEFDYLDSKNEQYYFKLVSNDTIFIQDATITQGTKLIDHKLENSAETILEQPCKEFSVNAKIIQGNIDYNLKFYFSDNIKIDGSRFKNIKMAFSNVVYGETNSIPLKFEISNPDFTIIATASNIKRTSDLNLFKVLKDKLAKHPSRNF